MAFKRLADLNKRMGVSIGILAILALLIAFSSYLIVSVFVAMVVATMAGLGVWEYANLAKAKGMKPATVLMMVVAVCEVLAFFIAHKFIHFPELPIVVFFLGLGLFFINRFREANHSIAHVAVEWFSIAYIAVPLGFMLGILYPIAKDLTHMEGKWWLVYLILVTKVTDIGAYFVGKLWGHKPLAPVLSPKKTVEGAIAGFICAVLLSLFMSYLSTFLFEDFFHLNLINALWLGILIGIFGQIGDLAESLLKRDASVKDSNALPGLGGVLDMIDSLIFTAPIIYFFLK